MRGLLNPIRRSKLANRGVWILLALWILQALTCTGWAHHVGHSNSDALQSVFANADDAESTYSRTHSDHSSPSASDCCDAIENVMQSDGGKFKFGALAVALFVLVPLFTATGSRRVRPSEYQLLPGIPITRLIAASLQPNAPPL